MCVYSNNADMQRANTVAGIHLYPRLCEPGALGEFLACVNVRVLRPLEGPLQLLQLVSRECCAAATLLPLQRNPGFGLRIGFVAAATYKKKVTL
jgi:hypothetical protein